MYTCTDNLFTPPHPPSPSHFHFVRAPAVCTEILPPKMSCVGGGGLHFQKKHLHCVFFKSRAPQRKDNIYNFDLTGYQNISWLTFEQKIFGSNLKFHSELPIDFTSILDLQWFNHIVQCICLIIQDALISHYKKLSSEQKTHKHKAHMLNAYLFVQINYHRWNRRIIWNDNPLLLFDYCSFL